MSAAVLAATPCVSAATGSVGTAMLPAQLGWVRTACCKQRTSRSLFVYETPTTKHRNASARRD